LDKVASRVWELIDGRSSLAKIKKKLLEEFDATEEEIDKKMSIFLKELKEIKAIK